jgi:hypothetical protein
MAQTAIREHLPYGFKSFTGVVWSDQQVDSYNVALDRINAVVEAGLEPSESLLNGAHNLFTTFSTTVQ